MQEQTLFNEMRHWKRTRFVQFSKGSRYSAPVCLFPQNWLNKAKALICERFVVTNKNVGRHEKKI